MTWLSCFPEEATGKVRSSAPMCHLIRKERHRAGTRRLPGTTRARERLRSASGRFPRPRYLKDVRELLSYEGTVICFNEMKEIPDIIDKATERVGRYPSALQGGVKPTKFGVWGDTNPPDEDHYIYQWDQGHDEHGEYVGRPEGYVFYFQPCGRVVEMKRTDTGPGSASRTNPFNSSFTTNATSIVPPERCGPSIPTPRPAQPAGRFDCRRLQRLRLAPAATTPAPW